jgi:hypothetical protein
MVPGSTPASFQNSSTDTPGKALQTHINGANAQNNNTRLDGGAEHQRLAASPRGIRSAGGYD